MFIIKKLHEAGKDFLSHRWIKLSVKGIFPTSKKKALTEENMLTLQTRNTFQKGSSAHGLDCLAKLSSLSYCRSPRTCQTNL